MRGSSFDHCSRYEFEESFHCANGEKAFGGRKESRMLVMKYIAISLRISSAGLGICHGRFGPIDNPSSLRTMAKGKTAGMANRKELAVPEFLER